MPTYADQYATSVPIEPGVFTQSQLHDLRRAYAERSTGELDTTEDRAIAEFIEWAFSSDRDTYDD